MVQLLVGLLRALIGAERLSAHACDSAKLQCELQISTICDVVESQIVEMLLSPYVWQKQTWTIEDSYFIFAHCRKNLTTHRWARAAYIQGLVEPIWTARRHYYEDWLGRLMDTTTNDNQEPGRIENCDTC